MNTIIEKIRAEVNRQARSIDTATGDFAEGRRMEQRIILSVLSDLEKEEKPTTAGGLEEEIINYFGRMPDDEDKIALARHFYNLGKQSKQPVCEGFDGEFSKFSNDVDAEHPFPICVDEYKDFARHFAQWGAEHCGSSETPKDLEEAARKHSCYDEDCEGAWYEPIVRNAFIAGAKWQEEQNLKYISEIHRNGYNLCREQMMKEAVEGMIDYVYDEKGDAYKSIRLDWLVGDFGDKVKVIVLPKED